LRHFIIVYLTKNLGADYQMIGVLGAVGSIAPVPAFYLADFSLQRMGQTGTMGLGLFVCLLAFAGFAFLSNPVWAFPLVVLYGFGTAFFLVSMVINLGQAGRPEQAATDQMLAQLTIPALAGMIALPVSGWVFDIFGGKVMFGLEAGVILFALFTLPRLRLNSR
jgi:hypothetical protein